MASVCFDGRCYTVEDVRKSPDQHLLLKSGAAEVRLYLTDGALSYDYDSPSQSTKQAVLKGRSSVMLGGDSSNVTVNIVGRKLY